MCSGLTHHVPVDRLLNPLGLRTGYPKCSSHRNRLTGAERDTDAAPATGRPGHSGIGDNSTDDDDIRNKPRRRVSRVEVRTVMRARHRIEIEVQNAESQPATTRKYRATSPVS